MNLYLFKFKVVLVVLFLYMFLGNVLRLIPLATAFGSMNSFELVLHFVCIVVLFLAGKDIKKFPQQFIYIYLFFFVSYLIGVIKVNEIVALAFTYNIRILLFFITSYVIGLSFFKLYQDNLNKILNFFLIIFVVNTLLAWVIYFIFPDTGKLYAFLSLFGIIFHGDPHLHRLLGTMFDPNFFGNILILPILFCLYMFDSTKSKKYLIIFMFLLLSEFFTFSRSSFLGLAMGISFYYLSDLKNLIVNLKIKKTLLISGFIFSIAGLGIIYLFPDEILRITERFTSIEQDSSAAHRYNDFILALDLLSEIDILFFGIGFNFFAYLGLTKLPSIDSSILSLMVTLGIPFFSIVAIVTLHFIKSSLTGLKIETLFIKKVFLNYLVVSLVLSNLNPLLLYPFWFFCIIPILCYFHLIKQARLKS